MPINKKIITKNKYKKRIKKTKKKNNKKIKKLIYNFLIKLLIFIVITILSLFIILTAYFLLDLPDINNSKALKRNAIAVIANGKDNNQIILSTYGNNQGSFIDYKELPQYFLDALLLTEDKNFFNHNGVDFLGMIRAAFINFYSQSIKQGGSTITQQLAKNLFLNNEKTFKRKIQEIILALYLESKYSKKDIINMYINRAYFGAGIYGIDAACKLYFNKNPKDMNLLESVLIVGMLKSPINYSPVENSEYAKKRAKIIIKNMYKAGKISDIDVNKNLSVEVTPSGRGTIGNNYFSDWLVYDYYYKKLHNQDNNLIVFSTLDLNFQKISENVLQDVIKKYGNKHNVTQGAVLLMRNDGKILSMVGGVNYQESNFNRATSALRQSGSLFKLFVYLGVLMNGWEAEDIIDDTAIKINNWEPKNYKDKYYGKVSLEFAFAKSLNSATVRIAKYLGYKTIIKLAKKMGITTNINNDLSISLGTTDIKLIDIATAYMVIANDGVFVKPYAINKIMNSKKELIYSYKSKSKRVISKNNVKKINKLLQGVVKYGTAKSLKQNNFITGGKTGTTQNFKDAWFIGFNNMYTLAVWLGNDNNDPMKKVTGGFLPVLVWKNIMKEVINYSNNDNKLIEQKLWEEVLDQFNEY